MGSQHERTGTARAERAVLFQLLREDHAERWELGELEAALSDVPSCEHAVAIERLTQHGAIVLAGDALLASRCARHLDSLGVVAI